MNGHGFAITVFILVGITGGSVELLARREASRLPTMAEVFTRVMTHPTGRAGALAGWVWTGYHFFAR